MASPELPFATWRFRDIPASYDLEKFCDIVPLSNGERILYSSLAPDPYTNAVTKVGTITWDRVPEYLQYAATSNDAGVRLHLLELSEDAASTEPRANGIWADAKFIGLTPLNAGSLQTENVSYV